MLAVALLLLLLAVPAVAQDEPRYVVVLHSQRTIVSNEATVFTDRIAYRSAATGIRYTLPTDMVCRVIATTASAVAQEVARDDLLSGCGGDAGLTDEAFQRESAASLWVSQSVRASVKALSDGGVSIPSGLSASGIRPALDMSKPVHVSGYTRQDGTYVREHTRSRPGQAQR